MRLIILLWLVLTTAAIAQDPNTTIEQNSTLTQQVVRQPKQPVRQSMRMAAKITLVSIANCDACNAARAYHKARYEASGWEWTEAKDSLPKGSYPQFIVCVGDQCERLSGSYMDLDNKVRMVIQRALNPLRRVAAPIKSAIDSAGYGVNLRSKPTEYRAPRKRWGMHEGHVTQSVTGQSIEFHLTDHHGIDIAGMTVDQMEAKHKQLHGWTY